jgi:hypothetical protein
MESGLGISAGGGVKSSFTLFVRRDSRRAAFRLWIIPLSAVLLITLTAVLKLVLTSSTFLFSSAVLTFLIWLLSVALAALFLKFRFLFCLMLFAWALLLGTFSTSQSDKFYSVLDIISGK